MTTSHLLPGTIWITGLSASGKTTLGSNLYKKLKERGISNAELLDGEELRERLDKPYGYSVEDRNAVIKNIVRVAREINEKGNLAIVCTISHKKQTREWVRSQFQHFLEVYLECSADVCAQRDYKDHYRRAKNGEYEMFVGITEPYETSENPELVLNTATLPIEMCLEKLLAKAFQRLDPKNPQAANTSTKVTECL